MGMWSRILLFFKIKTSAALDRAEDPHQTLDYAYAQQQELLRKLRQGLVEVATSKRQLEQRTAKTQERVAGLEDQARRGLGAGREDLARLSLERRQTALVELEGLQRQVAELAEEERKLTVAEQRLSARIEEFRTHREVVTARYSAAEAQVRVNEALSGISGDLAELSMAVGRAEEKTERMQASASALDALLESGALQLPISTGDAVERELQRITTEGAIEEKLAALKTELVQPPPPPALEGPRGER